MDAIELRGGSSRIDDIVDGVGLLDEGLADRIGVRRADRIGPVAKDDAPFSDGDENRRRMGVPAVVPPGARLTRSTPTSVTSRVLRIRPHLSVLLADVFSWTVPKLP